MVELSSKQQVVDIIKNNQNFLVLTHKNPDGDALGSSLALYLSLKKMGKSVSTACCDVIPDVFRFLPNVSDITQDFSGKRDFVISLDVSKTSADKIMYKSRDNKLDIIVTPKNGKFNSNMVTCTEGKFHFDAIIILDSPDIERIGNNYEENAEIFYEIPVVNIDHHVTNDHFGKINLIDLIATSTSEILVSVIEALTGDSKFFDEDIATSLLTGIITDTNSFQNTNTTPKSLTVAAQLVASGARQQEIIKHVYKTKPLSTLRLWGRALSALHDEKAFYFVWSQLRKADYVEVGASQDEGSGLIDELLKTASGIDFALLLSERNGDVHGSLRSSNRTKNVAEIAKLFDGGGHSMAAAFQLKNTSLAETSERIIQKIREHQKKQELKITRQKENSTKII